MSDCGQTWRIDGITAACIAAGPASGQYQVVFERSSAELTDIEAIHWASPLVEPLRPDCPALAGLPRGYGFTVEDVTYDHSSRSYTVTVQAAPRHPGDAVGREAAVQPGGDPVRAVDQEDSRRTTDPAAARDHQAPQDSRGLCQTGACCLNDGHVWRSRIDSNSWAPDACPAGREDLGAPEAGT